MKKVLLCAVVCFLPMLAVAGGYAVTITRTVSFTATTSSTLALSKNTARMYLIIQNLSSDQNITVAFGGASNTGIVIPPGGNYEPNKGIWDDVYIRSASGSQSVVILEGQ